MKKTSTGTIDQMLDALGIEMELSDEQRAAWKTLDWLGINGPPKSGRTTTLALHAIKTAMDNPGFRVRLVDHWAQERHIDLVVKRLLSQVEDEEVRDHFMLRNGHLTFGKHAKPKKVDITYNVTSTDDIDVTGLFGSGGKLK